MNKYLCSKARSLRPYHSLSLHELFPDRQRKLGQQAVFIETTSTSMAMLVTVKKPAQRSKDILDVAAIALVQVLYSALRTWPPRSWGCLYVIHSGALYPFSTAAAHSNSTLNP